jgi:hypothetical protein
MKKGTVPFSQNLSLGEDWVVKNRLNSSTKMARKHAAFAPASQLLGEGQWVKKPFEG